MRRIGAEGATMPDGTAARRGPGAMQDVDHHVARRIRERRIMLGLTQQQVAELVGVTYQQAHKYENGANRIAVGRLFAIAQALGVAPAHFFEGLRRERPAEPQERRMPELARDFLSLPSRRLQEAIADLARALAAEP
jgi:transcriptional regulator with XRE-family HTH domain